MHDTSDPKEVGDFYLAARATGVSIDHACALAVRKATPFDIRQLGPVEKYGRPDELRLVADARPPVFAREPAQT